MPTITLNIGDRQSVAWSRIKGQKTLFVKAIQNWPAATGQGEPRIALDIEITVRNRLGSVYQEDTLSLPNVGLLKHYTGDDIAVEIYYSPKQALATPYTQYLIAADIWPGFITKDSVSFSNRFWAFAGASSVPWPTTGSFSIPDFSTEVRIISSCNGYLLTGELSQTGAPKTLEYYAFGDTQDWSPLVPFHALWLCNVYSTPNGIAAGSYDVGSVTVEFR